MSHYLKSAKFCLIAAAFVVGSAFAAETSTGAEKTQALKGLTFSGYSEGGYAYSFMTGANQPHFLVDAANVKMNFDVSDKVKLVVDNAFAALPGGATAPTTLTTRFDSWNYFAPNTQLMSNNGFFWALNQAYLEAKWSDSFAMTVGQFKNVIGMESRWSRYDMPTYYYSQAYDVLQAFNAFYDVGVKLSFQGENWGNLEITVTDNKNLVVSSTSTTTSLGILSGMGGTAAVATNTLSPAAAIRYSYDYKNGDTTFTPVLSAYAGKLNNWSPQDYAFTGGLGYKSGVLMANAEFLYTSLDPNGTDTTVKPWKTWSVYLEPGVDLGMAVLSLKGEYYSQDKGTGTSNGDINLGVALSHSYSDKLRFRLAYQHLNFSQPAGGQQAANDVRLLVGTQF